MNMIRASSYEELSTKASLIIAAQILEKPDSVLGFATGSTPVGTYQELIRLAKQGTVDFGRVRTYNLDEYCGVPVSDPNSYCAFMKANLFDHINIGKDAYHLPDGNAADIQAECLRYEEAIAGAGGIDLQLLGIGHNGHIGFNEPADYFPDSTHAVALALSTIEANARFYNSADEVPRQAVSMGIGTIMRARKILMLVSGKDKKQILEKAVNGPVTPRVPASILQFHPCVTVIECTGD